jgi:hypothetical protein
MNKSKISTITIISILTISMMIIALPNVLAQDTVNPFPYINAIPNPVQVNKPTLFHVGSIYSTPTSMGGWTGLSVEITKPDSSTETISSINTDTTGGTGVVYTPTQVGTYSVRTLFPETVTPVSSGRWGPAGTIMAETWSDPIDLVVQEDAIPFYPERQLPTEYWVRPISSGFRTWTSISGNWLAYVPPTNPDIPSYRQPYNELAPDTGHVLFRKPLTMGGLAGGETGQKGFEAGDAYEGKFGGGGLFGARGIVIMGGMIFYNQFEARGGTNVEQEVVAVDIHTGEEIWRRPLMTPDGDVVVLSYGQQFYWDSYNYHGVFPYLWCNVGFGGSTMHAFDAFSGRWEYSMINVPSGDVVYGPKGEIFKISVNANSGDVRFWNSSRVVANAGSWRPHGNVYNCSEGNPRNGGVEWVDNVPELVDLPGSRYKTREGIIVGADFQRGSRAPDPATIWAISYDNDGADFMWSTTWDLPQDVYHVTVEDVSVEDDLILHSSKETSQSWGRSLSTGQLIWGPTPRRHYTDNWGHSSGNSWDLVYQGKAIAGNYGGTVWCYDATDGSVLWTFDIDDPYTEVLHNNRWRFRPVIITDGKLFIENTEHNPRDPQPRGAPFICLDFETGEEIWRLPYRQGEWSSTATIGDSKIVMQNTYDQMFYVVGKGPSATTIQVAPSMKLDSMTTISGTVMDVSPGTKDPTISIRFPNGVPAVSDGSMTDWMTYVYNQYPMPMATGVEVIIEAIDPNGNYQNFGTTTTDSNGNFGFSFEPEVPGQYMIMATFYGSGSYYGSTSTAYITVEEADQPVVIPPYPEYPGYQGPSAQDVANQVLADLPDEPTADEISNAVINNLPAYPEPIEPEIPEYTTIDLVILVLVIIAIIIGIVSLMWKR